MKGKKISLEGEITKFRKNEKGQIFVNADFPIGTDTHYVIQIKNGQRVLHLTNLST